MSNTSKPYIRFPLSEELHEKTIEMLDALEESENPKQYRDALGDLVVELTKAGMDYFFIGPLELAQVGFVKQKSATIGMAGIIKVMGPMICRIIGGLNRSQLMIICCYFRQLIH